MSELYDRIDALCAQKKVTITAMCSSAEVSRASLTDLKMGRKQNLAAETLMKIAQYFDVTMEYLLTGEEKRSTRPTSVQLVKRTCNWPSLEAMARSRMKCGMKLYLLSR